MPKHGFGFLYTVIHESEKTRILVYIIRSELPKRILGTCNVSFKSI